MRSRSFLVRASTSHSTLPRPTFAISDYRLVKAGLHQVGAFRLLLGAEPHAGGEAGLKPSSRAPLPDGVGSKLALKMRLQGDLETEPFNSGSLKLVKEQMVVLRARTCREDIELICFEYVSA